MNMKIAGRREELYFLFQKAIESDAEIIHFLPGGEVWLLYKTESYVYIRSQLFVTQSIFFSKVAMENMFRSFKRFKKEKTRLEEEGIPVPHQSMEITPSYIEYDNSPSLRTNMVTNMEKGSHVVDLSEKLRKLAYSVVELDKPYIRITPSLIKEYIKRVDTFLKTRGTKLDRKITFAPYADESKNHMHMSDYDFAVTRTEHDETFLFNDGFFVPRFYRSINIHLSDSDLLIMKRLSDIFYVEEYFIIPFEEYYIVESHEGEMIFKMLMPRNKRIRWSEVL